MFRFAPYLLKTLWRHRTRTLLTITGSAVALFVFCFAGAIQEGMDSLTSDASKERTLIVFQANRFCPFTSRIHEDYDRKIKKLPGVVEVTPIQVYTNNCRASLDVVVFHGVPPAQLRRARPDLRLVEGDWAQFERKTDGALVGRGLARRRNLSVGQAFKVGGISVTIAGIFAAHEPSEEDYVYTPLKFLQRQREQNSEGFVTQFEVQLSPDADPQATAKAIDDLFRGGPVATDTRTKGVFQAQSLADLVELIEYSHYLGYACVALVLALVATTTVMAVQDRVGEHAVLQTIGCTAGRIFSLVVSESVIVSILGGLLGIGAAMATLAFYPMTFGAEAVTIAFTPSLDLALKGMIVAAAVGLIAGLMPAWQASRANIVMALRQL
jgi:putative ABC transport system permease protein